MNSELFQSEKQVTHTTRDQKTSHTDADELMNALVIRPGEHTLAKGEAPKFRARQPPAFCREGAWHISIIGLT